MQHHGTYASKESKIQAQRVVKEVTSQQLVIDLPESFINERVEVIVLQRIGSLSPSRCVAGLLPSSAVPRSMGIFWNRLSTLKHGRPVWSGRHGRSKVILTRSNKSCAGWSWIPTSGFGGPSRTWRDCSPLALRYSKRHGLYARGFSSLRLWNHAPGAA